MLVSAPRDYSGMSSAAFDQVRAAFDALAAHADEPTELWTTRQRREHLDRIETLARMLPGLAHGLINQLAADATGEELGGSLSHALANWLRISRHEAARRIHEAANLGCARSADRRGVGAEAGRRPRPPSSGAASAASMCR